MEGAAVLCVDPSSLETAASGAVTGRIWFEGVHPFPDAGWYDFPIVVLSWWLELLLRLATGQAKTAELRFMDGPFRIRVFATDDNALVLEFWSGRALTPLESNTTDLNQAMAEGISCARALLAECKTRGWTSADIERLEKIQKEAQKAVRAILRA